MTNPIRPGVSASLLAKGEALSRSAKCGRGRPVALRGSVLKRRRPRRKRRVLGTQGGWGRNGRKAVHVKQGDLCGEECRIGVRALIVALKRGNARGAKGCRKVDA